MHGPHHPSPWVDFTLGRQEFGAKNKGQAEACPSNGMLSAAFRFAIAGITGDPLMAERAEIRRNHPTE
ncbi:MAG: hypothetical protein D6753_11725 [Planctomycetota bacterium]|nr:MAG: hypothetical protein D6753_11725 [Planctomycetota bacterium]